MADAAARVRQLGDPLLAEHADSAMRKLACDLPVDAAGGDAPQVRAAPAEGARRAPRATRRRARAPETGHLRLSRHGQRRRGRPHGRAVRPLLPQPALVSRRARAGRGDGQELPPQPDRRRLEVNAGEAGHAGLRDPGRVRSPRPRPFAPGLGARRRRRRYRRRAVPGDDGRRLRRVPIGRGGRGPAASSAGSGCGGPTLLPAGSSPSPATSSRSPRASSSTEYRGLVRATREHHRPIAAHAMTDTAADQLRRILHLIPRWPTGRRTGSTRCRAARGRRPRYGDAAATSSRSRSGSRRRAASSRGSRSTSRPTADPRHPQPLPAADAAHPRRAAARSSWGWPCSAPSGRRRSGR